MGVTRDCMGTGFPAVPAIGGETVAPDLPDRRQIGRRTAGWGTRSGTLARRWLLAARHAVLALTALYLPFGLPGSARAQAVTDVSQSGGPQTQGTAVTPSLPSTTLVTPLSPLSVGEASVARPLWTFNPRIAVDQAFTDNARGSPPGQRRYDLYTTVLPGALVDFYSNH
ncbi:MAG TPA: hypothetical protein PKJ56_11275, partial [Promineifilum sp.]|nr:hypothetical protein [Promineifilum sp.]